MTFYANYDDTFKGGVEKLLIAEQTGFQMLLPDSGITPKELLSLMAQLATSKEAKGAVIVLDTLKKFTDLMDKKESSRFGEVARTFVSAGGTLICLAHVNKNKSCEGKSVYSGTSDIRDDADCAYMIELLSENEGPSGIKRTVEFENIKARGDVAVSQAFQYTRMKGAEYASLQDSVKRISKKDAQLSESMCANAAAIEAIKAAIENGQSNKSSIESFVTSTSEVSHRDVRRVLDRYEERLWKKSKGANNAYIYSLIIAPEPPISFM